MIDTYVVKKVKGVANNIIAVTSAISSLVISSLIAVIFIIKVVVKTYKKVKSNGLKHIYTYSWINKIDAQMR